MMRSLFSGVSGLKVHQTKMDVIGNNIANVNTSGFKASNVNFSDIFYQTTQSATGPNAQTGAAGQNAMQIGLGSNLSSIVANITTPGGAQRTDNPLDIMITGDAFFIVNSGGTNYFTKSGAFNIDGAGTLCTSSGASVMGWQVDNDGNIKKGQVSALRVNSPENQYADPELTTKATVKGQVVSDDPDLLADGSPIQISFYDNLGNPYTAQLRVKAASLTDAKAGKYSVELVDITGSNGSSLFYAKNPTTGLNEAVAGTEVTFGGLTYKYDPAQSKVVGTGTAANVLQFNPSNGTFDYVGPTTPPAAGAAKPTSLNMKITTANGEFVPPGVAATAYAGIEIGMDTLNMYGGEGKSSSLTATRGDAKKNNEGAGLEAGELKGVTVDTTGKIYGVYTNGTQKLLGQIAVTTFSNPAGLEAVGGNMFAQTKNSGEFDGIGQDVTSDGGKMNTGVLEMSNVDLSNEFTQMITTQRGFQANSRIITTSDSLLEELINLKR